LLREEEERAGVPINRPSSWIIEREEREYAMADHIGVLSTFAKRSFVDQGVPPDKVSIYPLGVDSADFRPEDQVIEDRCRRIESGEPLRVLYVGTLAYQKGMLDAIEVARKMNDENVQFRFVGPVSREFSERMDLLKQFAEHVPNQPQSQLPGWYAKGDIFLFPTVQDGFAMVLTQAWAAGLPLLATTNSAAPDLVEEGENGWVLPIRSPEAFVKRLEWYENHRDEFADMVEYTYRAYRVASWEDTAVAFEEVCDDALASSSDSVP
jgi:glycosyltransferase involved in cell wall biosynthesis